MKKTPITILNGFLGSGKTTLLNHLLINQTKYKIALLINDIGTVNIDANHIKNVTSSDAFTSMIELSNGCICCSLKDDLILAIDEILKTDGFDYIIIESSGMTEPIPVVESILLGQTKKGELLQKLTYINSLVAVVDCFRLKNEFHLGKDFIHECHCEHHDHDHELSHLMAEQIEFADTVILNKKDLVDQEEFNLIKSYIINLNPKAKIYETSFGKVDVFEILENGNFNLKNINDAHKHEHHEHDHIEAYGVKTFVYQRKLPFNRRRFIEVYNELSKQLLRSKGTVWLSDDHQASYFLSQASLSVNIIQSNYWLGIADKMYVEIVLNQNPKLKEIWDDKYQDRYTEIVIIGKDIDEEYISKMLDSALLSSEELVKSFNIYLEKNSF